MKYSFMESIWLKLALLLLVTFASFDAPPVTEARNHHDHEAHHHDHHGKPIEAPSPAPTSNVGSETPVSSPAPADEFVPPPSQVFTPPSPPYDYPIGVPAVPAPEGYEFAPYTPHLCGHTCNDSNDCDGEYICCNNTCCLEPGTSPVYIIPQPPLKPCPCACVFEGIDKPPSPSVSSPPPTPYAQTPQPEPAVPSSPQVPSPSPAPFAQTPEPQPESGL